MLTDWVFIFIPNARVHRLVLVIRIPMILHLQQIAKFSLATNRENQQQIDQIKLQCHMSLKCKFNKMNNGNTYLCHIRWIHNNNICFYLMLMWKIHSRFQNNKFLWLLTSLYWRTWNCRCSTGYLTLNLWCYYWTLCSDVNEKKKPKSSNLNSFQWILVNSTINVE